MLELSLPAAGLLPFWRWLCGGSGGLTVCRPALKRLLKLRVYLHELLVMHELCHLGSLPFRELYTSNQEQACHLGQSNNQRCTSSLQVVHLAWR